MHRSALLAFAVLSLAAASAVCAADAAPPAVDVPFTEYVLDNGLTLVVHEDHKAPIVAVNVWYHVGSKNEKEGKTGFAHLFEHLMFNGSENWDDEYFKPFDRVGATGMNGTTNWDRTNYFETVPTPALDLALWMESDRMGHLVGVIDQARLDEQRGVVQNEKRQGENQPYGTVFQHIARNLFPPGHPYSWLPIGSMEDLNAASLEDVKEWFASYYGAANAVVVIAGDVEAEEARRKVERYFGDIPAGPPVAHHRSWVPQRSGTVREVMQDRVPQARLYKVWAVPPWGTADEVRLDLVTDVLTQGKTSRLYKRLVYDDQIATDVRANLLDQEIAGIFIVYATAQPGQGLEAVEKALDEEMARLLEEGPDEAEVERVKTQLQARFLRGIERVGGFRGKSGLLAESEVYGGRPDAYRERLRRVASATPEELRQAARRWLSDGAYVLEVHPFPSYQTQSTVVDRSALPETGAPPAVRFPRLERSRLANGLEVVLAERHAVPVVELELLLDAGFAADQLGIPGTADLALDSLDEGTEQHTALEISERLADLGAELDTGSNLDLSTVHLSALRQNLDASLALFAEVVLHPSFPEAEVARLKKQQLAAIQREKVTPNQMALRVFPKLLYGEGHPYALPLTGSGTEESVRRLTRQDLVDFHRRWFMPNNATLVVVGDTTLDEMVPKLERLFAAWQRGEAPDKHLARVEARPHAEVYLIDRPGSDQSLILAGNLAPPKANPQEIAIEAMNQVLGGSFTSRINMNLREDKHWSYGARTLVYDARGQRPFLVYAPVQTDKTKESIREVEQELEAIVGERPPAEAEVETAKDKNALTLPGRWETAGAVADDIVELVRFGLPDDFWDRYAERVRGLDQQQVAAAAETVVHPRQLVWVVVGDRAKIEAGIRELGLGTVRLIDADGNPVTGGGDAGTAVGGGGMVYNRPH